MPKRLAVYRGVWCVYWREGEKSVRRSLGTSDEQEALRRFAKFEEIRIEQNRDTLTVAECWQAYQAHLADRPAALTMGYEGRSLLPILGDTEAVLLTAGDVEDYIRERRDAGRKDGTILTELNRLAACLNFCAKRGLITKAPFIPKVASPPPKDRYLTRPEAARLVASCRFAHGKLFLILALTTAARAGALLELTWDRVDLTRRLIYLTPAQPGRRIKGRAIVPINDSAYRALSAINYRTGNVIIWAGEPVASIKKLVATAAKAARLDGVSPHVLRHTAAVWMAESGVRMSEISQYLGHSSTAVTERIYARYSPEYLRTAASALEVDF
jgi:integrase